MTLEDIVENFELLDEWDDRYRYLIELGRTLQPLDEGARNDQNKVRGCASQVWLDTHVESADEGPRLSFRGDSDAHIVRGLIALVFAVYSGKSATTIVETDIQPVFDELDLSQHLTPQRSNGLRSMVERIKRDARDALA